MKAEEFAERLWEFAVRVGKTVDALPETRLGGHVADQLLRSGTTSAPNYEKACAANDPDEVSEKLDRAATEMRETLGWLQFTVRSGLLPAIKLHDLIDESAQLLKMLPESVRNSKERTASPRSPVSSFKGLKGLDHLAIAVPNTDEALKTWRDRLGFEVLSSEDVNDGTVRLTHLDLGNTQLQLVQPLATDHPLHAWLQEHGPGLHHFGLLVEDVSAAMTASPTPTAPSVHEGTGGKRALFLDPRATQDVQVELTGS
jgi:methylmalonyl-CoA/ethylmalonyl-CoA epimerase